MTVARFLTLVPLGPGGAASAPGALAQAAWAFPVVGAVIGAAIAAVFALAVAASLPGLAASVLAVGAGIVLTGALHEDGLADSADALAGADQASRLAIMRDSRSGVYGVLAIVVSVLLRAAAIDALAGRWAVLGALAAAHAAGRGGLPAALYLLPPARSDGLGADAGRPGEAGMAWSLAISAAIAVAALGVRAGLAALAASCVVMALIGALAWRGIGGHTGDILGAIEQGGETTMLLAAASWAT